MPLDFPNSPAVNATFNAPNGVTYTFDGVKWTTGGAHLDLSSPGPIGGTTPNVATFTSITEVDASAPVRNYTFKSNNASVAFPVPTVQPTTSPMNIAFDVRPMGSPGEFAGNGYAWIDVQPNDLGTQVTARMGITAAAAEFGNRTFGGATAKPTIITANGNTGLTVNPDGSIATTFAAYLGTPGNGVIPSANQGLVVGWNYYTGAGEVDYWCGWGAATTSHTFLHRTSGGAAVHLMDISPTGNVRAYGGIDNTAIGATSPAAGSFTSLFASGPLAVGTPGNGVTPAANNGAVVGWNFYTGAGEVDYWNGFGAATVSHTFMQRTTGGAATHLMDISPTGTVRAYAGFALNAAGPTIFAGTGAATGTQPKGSLWLRTDGAVGSTMYISQGAGVWNPVTGV